MAMRKSTLILDKHTDYGLANRLVNPTTGQKTHIFDLATRLEQFMALYKVWRRRQKDREALATMPAHMLRDIGVSRAEADAKIRKPFWRA